MKTNKIKLGKVSITIDKEPWDINKDYDRLTIVELENAYCTYISRKPVPNGIDIENKEYWMLFSKYSKTYNSNEGVFNMSKYLKLKNKEDDIIELTLEKAVTSAPLVIRNAGQIITFINKNKEWQRYQYQGTAIENWTQLTLWKDLNNISEDIPVSEDVMVFNITEYMPGGSKYKQAIWAGIYTIDGITPVSQYRLIFGCDASLGIVEGVDMDASDTLAIIDMDTDDVAVFSYILFVGNSIDGYRYQTTINSDEDVPDWIAKAFGNNSSYIAANIESLERRVNNKLNNKVDKIQGKGLSTNDFTNANVSELANSVANATYNSNTKKIIFTKNNNESIEIDATPFIKDGMVDSVSIVDGYLVITFNTDSGKETIRIALVDIFNLDNYYTKAQVDTALSSKQDTINDLATIRSGAALGATAVQTETDPTVPSWAKQQSKPTYTASEVGALPVGTTSISDLSDGTRVDDIEDALEEKANKIPMPDVVHELVVKGTSQVSDVINLITGRFEEFPAESIQIFGTFKNPSIIEFSVNYTGKLRFKGIRESVILKYIKAYVNGTLVETSTERIIDSEILSFNVEANDVVKVEFTIYSETDYFYGCIGYLSITSAGVPKDLVDVYNDLENKVDKISGKGLSTNDYTTEEKTKLAGIEEGATANEGTITGITMNGVSKGTSGVVNLGTVLTTTTGNVTSGSITPITSGGVYSALQGYETKLNFTTYSGTSLTLVKNNYYRFTNNPTSLSITLPSSPSAGDQCAFCVTTGSTFSSITFSGSYVLQDGWAIGANTTYEVIALYNGSTWLVTATAFTL